MTDTINPRIGDYEILGVLGAGGMGKVYRVRNVVSDRVEAMKILLPSLSDHREVGERFLREIKLVASLHHPNIANLCTAQTLDNHLIMVMEFVDGDTFSDLLDHRAVPLTDALNYFDQALAALGYAHTKGIVHRDIKPSNLMLTPEGVVKLMDFGIARNDSDRALTQTGATIGTVSYMSPEQIAGRPVDGRSDLYSMGIFLYETVTGEQPFKGTSDYELMAAHMNQTPRPPIQMVPNIPDALNGIILKLLVKDPADRFQTAAEVRDAIRGLAEYSSVTRGLPRIALAAAATAIEAPAFPSRSDTIVEPATASGTLHLPTTLTTVPPGTLVRDAYTERRMTEVSGMPTYSPPPPSTALAVRSKGLARHPVLYAGAGLALAGAIAAPVIFAHRAADRTSGLTSDRDRQAIPAPGALPPPPPNVVAAAHPAPTQPGRMPPAPALPRHAVSPVAPVTPQPKPGQATVVNAGTVPAPAPVPAPSPVPALSPELKAKLDDEEVHIDQVSNRAVSINNSLNTMQRSMQKEGLSLRGDIAAKQSSMNTNLTRAKQALALHDVERASKFSTLAQTDADGLASFLGR